MKQEYYKKQYRLKEVIHSRMNILSVLFISLSFILALSSYAISSAGQTGAEFLLMPSGAKIASMGGASIAVIDNINTVFCNPAGLALIKGKEISATHAQWLTDISYETAGFGYCAGRAGSFGISAIYLHMGDMQGRSLNGTETEEFSAYDAAAALSYGNRVSKNVSMGTNIKFIRQMIEDEAAFGTAFDFGCIYKLNDEKTAIGGSLLNLGTGMKFIKEEYSLPLMLNLGASYKINSVIAALDIKYRIFERYASMGFGAEYMPADFLSLRGSYLIKAIKNSDMSIEGDKLGGLSGLGAGLGFKFGKYQFDYSFIPFASLGSSHILSFTGSF